MGELVSIVVPVFNMGKSIENCVISLQKQDYAHIEIILVDDGSLDNSFEQCKKMEMKDSRIRAFHTENRGSGPARNYGITQARGRYVYFPDADDYLEPEAITTMVEAMDGGEFDLVVFGFRWVNQNGKVIRIKRYDDMQRDAVAIRKDYSDYMTTVSKYGIQGAPWNKFFDLKLIKQNHIEYPALRRHQDEGFIARYMCFATRVHFIENVLYTYYVNDLKKEWEKYPVDYIDAVIGLNDTRKDTILRWNPDDSKTHESIDKEYICNIIKSLELSFSPKMMMNHSARKIWLKNSVKKSRIRELKTPNSLGLYQRLMMKIIAISDGELLYITLLLKVFIQKSMLFEMVRGKIKR